MFNKFNRNNKLVYSFLFLSLFGATLSSAVAEDDDGNKPVKIDVFAPANGDRAGVDGRGWFVDLAVRFPTELKSSGFNGFQITGPGAHNNVDPFPGSFSPGTDEKLPGLIVLLSGTTIGAQSCQNLANLFNLTGVSDVRQGSVELWDSWIVGAPLFGTNTKSTLYIAVAADSNGDGIFNDAPGVVNDSNGDAKCDKEDLEALGLASKVKQVEFYIN